MTQPRYETLNMLAEALKEHKSTRKLLQQNRCKAVVQAGELLFLIKIKVYCEFYFADI